MLHIISPHIDDAILSLGGLVLNQKKMNKAVVIEYVFSISNWTNPESIEGTDHGTDPNVITLLRKKEEELVSKRLSYDYTCLDFAGKELRGEQNEASQSGLRNDIEDKLTSLITKTDVCMFPLGLVHSDHIITRNLGLNLYKKGYEVLFYEDLPYAALSNYDYERQSEIMITNGFEPQLEQIDIQAKLDVLKLYASQVSPIWLKSIKNYSYCLKSNVFYERFWRRKTAR